MEREKKAPIRKQVTVEFVNDLGGMRPIEAAVEFYTATTADIVGGDDGNLYVVARGYRNGPAGDF